MENLFKSFGTLLESEAGDKLILLTMILYFGISAFYMNIDFYYRLIDTLVGALIMQIRGGGAKEKVTETTTVNNSTK